MLPRSILETNRLPAGNPRSWGTLRAHTMAAVSQVGHHLRSRAHLRLAIIAVLAAQAGFAATKVGFIGLRHGHAWRQLADISSIEEAHFVGVAESIPGIVEQARTVQPDARFYADYREFVREERPEIVWAFVENNRHVEIAEHLAPLGVHLIFEKPLAGTFEDARRIQQLAEEHGILVMTNYQMAWWPSNHEQRRLAASGAIGDVWRLHGVVGNAGPSPRDLRRKVFFDWLTDPEANGGGALIDFGVYGAVWAAWHLGRPSTVYSTVSHLQPERFPRVEDNAVMVLSYPRAVGIFEASWDLPAGTQQLEIHGRSGTLSLVRDSLSMRVGRKKSEAVESPGLAPEASHPVRYMIDRVRRGEPLGHIVELQANVLAVQILEAAKRSAKSGSAVSLPLPEATQR